MIKILLISVSTVFITGCTSEYFMGHINQSNFTYPESSVVPLKNAKGISSQTTFGSPNFSSGQLHREAIDAALDSTKSDANTLIDYKQTIKSTVIPFPLLPIFNTSIEVEGIAAKAEIN